MFLIDDLLMSPISGIKFVLRTLVSAAEQEWTDDAPVKERLLELQVQLENGDISEQEYVEQEREVLALLRDIQRRKMEMAGVDPDSVPGAGVVIGGKNKATLEISAPSEFKEHDR